ncbi:MAG: acylphosphatase [Aromatoleum sp.]|jgi:acylphosphatase|uniref:acylphosphatase n=1 Tax=Aromatoleum sp. TaxID=2307007 RepID=UPI002893BA64|nr:acylphosphatase [Aromatoleum sp.]MDT3670750.1 acylphosphatase [Aromatoleum sp.]
MREQHDESGRTALRLTVYGRVQGVSYRANAQTEALHLGLQGWIRNRHDGAVEALVIGPHSRVDAFVEWARNGPPGARVDRLEVSIAEFEKVDAFSVWPTV